MKHSIQDVLNNFKMAKPKKTVFGNYRIVGNELIYSAQTSREVSIFNEEDRKSALSQAESVNGEFYKRVYTQDKNEHFAVNKIKTAALNNIEGRYLLTYTETNTIAKKMPQKDGSIVFLGNSSILPLVGRTVSYGNVSLNTSVTPIQTSMQGSGFVMIPFSVFLQANLNIESFQMIDKGPEQSLKIKTSSSWETKKKFRNETRHFTGASLFKVDSKYYLFDVDRRELKHKIFNPFLVNLPKSCKTIAEAYEILKPKQVKDAEKRGLKVLRQGEWFFIPCKTPRIPKLTDKQKIEVLSTMVWSRSTLLDGMGIKMKKASKLSKQVIQKTSLKVGNNRPNDVDKGIVLNGVTYVSGKVSHQGREHAELKLKGWYIAIPNTSNSSFTITGDVD